MQAPIPLEQDGSDQHSSRRTKCVVFTLLFTLLLEIAGIAVVFHCRSVPLDNTSQALPLVGRLGGSGAYQASNLPGKRDPQLFKECEALTLNQTMRNGLVFGHAQPAEALKLLDRCTRIPGLIEQVPEVLRGVFWMKDSPSSEEVAVLQMGQWFPEERTYILPFAPFMWAWNEEPESPEPSALPISLLNSFGQQLAHRSAAFLAEMRYTLSFKFSECPGPAWMPWPLGLPGQACEKGVGAGADLRYAAIQHHPGGDLTVSEGESQNRLEAMAEGATPGDMWRRGKYSAPSWLGGCKCIALGSCTMVKVIDAQGQPLEPYHSQFLEYMGNKPLLLWTGVMQNAASN